ncbi:hypothetical protein BQ9231_00489 [Cedratvirus lausannensis]|uniref:Uncharacterized protein n=1 Tax=Cedratvirus lausannensis TaxID=2023205 RepID=A0A285PYT8_9VIRU|nr:hypothetical protein Cbor_144 [Cedratvirus borely]WIL03484.1 hypothetical protein Cplu_140 [Cedratvirus plubellavi]SOB74372.1 hypothetical protein BQ9231_00489 [Cedratvirus lausannensis]
MSCTSSYVTGGAATAPAVVNTGTSIGNIAWGIALGFILLFLILAVIGLIIGAFAAPSAANWMRNNNVATNLI